MKFVVFFHNATKSYQRHVAVFAAPVAEYLEAQHRGHLRMEFEAPMLLAGAVSLWLSGGDLEVFTG